jgi:hypothetical protein
MTHQEILEKAIGKAIEAGWHNLENWSVIDLGGKDVGIVYDDTNVTLPPHALIMTHDFAKALWGEEFLRESNGDWSFVERPAWQFYLMMMVIAEDPIEYLGQHI